MIVTRVDKPQLIQLSPKDYSEMSTKRDSLPDRATNPLLKTRLALLKSRMLGKLSEGDTPVEPTLNNSSLSMMLTQRATSMLMIFSHKVRRLA